jgi:predicted secreted hydrolase
MRRRTFLLNLAALAASRAWAATFAPVVAGTPIVFPRDYGSHPAFRSEWWYVTGWLSDARGNDYGFQVTFFRNRPGVNEASASAFAPHEILFAHAALADPARGRLRYDQRAARAGFGLAEAAERTTDVHLDRWSLVLERDRYAAHITARDFALDFSLGATQPELLQGERGVSRKGPRPEQASYYYSTPQLQVEGTIETDGVKTPVTGVAWLDHEWSSEYLAADAVGWDWTGVNLADGGALMAFRIRGRGGGAFYAGGAIRDASGAVQTLAPGDVRFVPLRRWRSPHTGVDYPVAMKVTAGAFEVTLEPLFDDQELDARASAGTVYWEGAVRATRDGRLIGRGYLELTGYGEPLKL